MIAGSDVRLWSRFVPMKLSGGEVVLWKLNGVCGGDNARVISLLGMMRVPIQVEKISRAR